MFKATDIKAKRKSIVMGYKLGNCKCSYEIMISNDTKGYVCDYFIQDIACPNCGSIQKYKSVGLKFNELQESVNKYYHSVEANKMIFD